MRYSVAVIVCVGLCVPSLAGAGSLGKVTKSISNKQGRSGGNRGGSSSPPRNRPTPRGHHHHYYDRSGYIPYGCYTCGVAVAGSAGVSARGMSGSGPMQKPRVDLYVGVQSVRDSDGAFAGSIAVGGDNFNIGFNGTSYFEKRPTVAGDETIRMNVISVTLGGRMLAVRNTELWIRGGWASSGSTDFKRMTGPTLGMHLELGLGRDLAGLASVRGFLFDDGVSATELRVGVRAHIFTVSYRKLQFDVGPPLEGPEAGISLRF